MVDICSTWFVVYFTFVIQKRTAPQLQAVRLFHDIRASNAGSQRYT
jgi:hypothetical protein